MKPLEPFVYSDEQWARMETIVSRAGGDAARDKLNAQRASFERTAAGWKERHRRWNGHALSPADVVAYKRVGRLARELIGVFDELSEAETNNRLLFPAILASHDLIWEGLAEPRENRARFANFRGALDHTARRAEQITKSLPKRSLLASRHIYFADLGRVWRADLGLKITTGTKALFVQFVEAASKGVYQFSNVETAADAIVNSMKSWPRRPECKNDAENN